MEIEVSAFGAIIGLIISIIMILKKIPPVYGLMTGALIGGLIGGTNIVDTVSLMVSGAQGIIPSVLRILAAGILAGILIESGAAAKIAQSIVTKFGEKRALLALALATMFLTAVGVFVDVAVITVAPIALVIASNAGLSRIAILLAMVGGGKAGNVMSPNPNTIAVSDAFNVPLISVMGAGVIPAIFGIVATYIIAKKISSRGTMIEEKEIEQSEENTLPSLFTSLLGPIVAIVLLALRPLFDINIDPIIALPVGGLIGIIAMGQWRNTNDYIKTGLEKMAPVAILLIGTGTLAGIIQNSRIDTVLINALEGLGLPAFSLAPVSGIFMSGATASTTAGATVASSVFASTLLEMGVAALGGAAMIHAGSTVIDHMPHGSFFHATAGSVGMQVKERLKLIPYETLVGLTIAIVSTIIYGIIPLFF
ncbi:MULTISPECIES: SLC13 family permease [Oceanobacillus]|uniref:Gluconate:proton symporter n=1 Tax=Oceanobacillus kimchii TaxID=746691 RepID=A0ABQ5TMQ8_9BACI|nr:MULTISPECIES: SLC13 family permease [Oceanobacillus]MBT2600392.1 GntP family permease [Oceanobacillus sp. ISL-74]MBT2650550.1 GntP family permease [Oceanobacillus sp. ISL-73]MCT1578291.1 SLC13 family permease [Oceanobacillus kimchii]MCT2134469.1 SLC13 family permease [Oceanobacillus kimchii]OEH54907.1 gluconate:proton symporter [Oceanobacillus sp. E9]